MIINNDIKLARKYTSGASGAFLVFTELILKTPVKMVADTLY
jgi:hypothetical protein